MDKRNCSSLGCTNISPWLLGSPRQRALMHACTTHALEAVATGKWLMLIPTDKIEERAACA